MKKILDTIIWMVDDKNISLQHIRLPSMACYYSYYYGGIQHLRWFADKGFPIKCSFRPCEQGYDDKWASSTVIPDLRNNGNFEDVDWLLVKIR